MRQKGLFEMSTDGAGGGCALRFVPCMPEAERLVALGFRYWMIGLSTGDIGAWERAWCLYSGLFGAAGARHSVGCLSEWVSAVGASTCREVEVFPERCRSFCRDECLAVSLIAACQHQTVDAARASAFALVETSSIGQVIERAQAFAGALDMLEHRLAAASILVTAGCVTPATASMQ
jgi:hypothetical protein